MATRRIQAAPQVEDAELVEDIQDQFPQEEEDAVAESQIAAYDLLEILGDDSAQGKVVIYRIVRQANGSTNEELLYETTADVWGGWSEVQEAYGKGDYRVRVFAPRPMVRNGQNVRRMGLIINRRQSLSDPPGGPKQATLPATASPQPTDFHSVLRELNAQNQQMLRGMLEGLATIMSANRQPQPTEDDLLRRMAVMKTIFSPPPAPAALPALEAPRSVSVIDQLREIAEVQKLMRGMAGDVVGEDGEPSLMSLGGKLLDVLSAGGLVQPQPQPQAVQQPRPQAPAQNFRAIAPQPPASVIGANPQQPQGENDMGMMQDMLYKAVLGDLIKKAQMNSDPYAYAVMLLDQFGDDQAGKFLASPDWWDTLTRLDPNVAAHRQWFENLHVAALGLLQEETEESVETGNDNDEAIRRLTDVHLPPH